MVAHASVASSKPKVELDSHADTCVVGDNYLVVQDHNGPVYVYSYDPVSCCVSRDIRDGFIHDVHPSGSACIVFIDDRSHYMLFHYYDNDSELSQSDSHYLGIQHKYIYMKTKCNT